MEKGTSNPFLYGNKLDLVKVVENQYLGKSNSFDIDGHVTDHAKITTIVATRFIERERKVALYKTENISNITHINGELYEDSWKNFAHNRTLALNAAFNKTDLLFLLPLE